MFLSKKSKIKAYLTSKQEYSAFDKILQNWVDRKFCEKLSSFGLSKVNVHIDWIDTFKCIGVQARKDKYYVDIQIYPISFTIAYSEDEADDDTEYPLLGAEEFYSTIKEIIVNL